MAPWAGKIPLSAPTAVNQMKAALLALSVFLFATVLHGSGLPQKFEKWLNEEAVYIISSQERDQFLKISTDAERDAFIDRFWKMRDTDPSTEENEFRSEHYARIKYVNERYGEGVPGWRTDRGRIWIMHGPPDDIHYEYGGGSLEIDIENPTAVLTGDSSGDRLRRYRLAFNAPETEIWVYRHIGGARNVTSYFEIIFSRTDPTQIYQLNQSLRSSADSAQSRGQRYHRDFAIMTVIRGHYFGGPYRIVYAGEYRFQDLDDFYQSIFHPMRLPRVDGSEYGMALQDLERSPGELLMEKLTLGRTLREKVRSRIFFEDLPLHVRVGTMQSRSGSTVLPISVGIPHQDDRGHLLGKDGDTLDLALELVNRQGDTAASLIDTVKLHGKDAAEASTERYLYQTRLAARPGEYRLSIYAALRNHNSSALRELDVRLPDYGSGALQMSDLLLFGSVLTREAYKKSLGRHELPEFLGQTNPVFLKDHVLIPSSDSRFRRSQKLTAFFEVYNPGIPSGAKVPSLQVHCRFTKNDGQKEELPEKLLSYLTDSDLRRTTYGISIPLISFATGQYSLQFDVYDPVQRETVSKMASFTVY